MIDTIILLVGLVGVSLISSLCILEYSDCIKPTAATTGLKKIFPLTSNVHSFVLSAACICTFIVVVVSAQFNRPLHVSAQAVASDTPVSSVMSVKK